MERLVQASIAEVVLSITCVAIGTVAYFYSTDIRKKYQHQVDINNQLKEKQSASKKKNIEGSLYLDYEGSVKKIKFENDLTVERIHKLFVETFSLPQKVSLPTTFYLRDADGVVFYELQDIHEIAPGSTIQVQQKQTDRITRMLEDVAAEVGTLNSRLSSTETSRLDALNQHHVHPNATSSSGLPEQIISEIRQTHEKIATLASSITTTKIDLLVDTVHDLRAKVGELVATPNVSSSSAEISSSISTVLPSSLVPPPATSRNSSDDKVEKIRQLGSYLSSVRDLKANISTFKAEFATLQKAFKADVHTLTQRVKATLIKAAIPTRQLSIDKDNIFAASQLIDKRLEEVKASLELTRTDVTKHRVRPSAALIKFISTELKVIEDEINKLESTLKESKPRWKKTWESELQQIVAEQKLMKQQEDHIADQDEKQQELAELFAVLEKVSIKLAEVAPKPVEFIPQIEDVELSDKERRGTLMQQITMAGVDPQKRLDAVNAAQKARRLELASRTNPFEDELGDFVSHHKFKTVGNFDKVEQLRQEREKAALNGTFQL